MNSFKRILINYFNSNKMDKSPLRAKLYVKNKNFLNKKNKTNK